MFCVYLTYYQGDKLPHYYVGSTSVESVENGYHGSVRSKRWKSVWDEELRENNEMFETVILSYHTTRSAALHEELRFQKENDVVRSKVWINDGYAQPNGAFGRDVSGELNPMFGKTHSPEMIEVIKTIHTGRKDNDETRKKKSVARLGDKNPMFGKRGELSPHYGKKRPDHSEKMKVAMKGNTNAKNRSEEARIRAAEAASVSNKTKHQCDICGKWANKGNLARWHGENKCKKPE